MEETLVTIIMPKAMLEAVWALAGRDFTREEAIIWALENFLDSQTPPPNAA